MVELILAIDQKGGLGLNGKIPWNCREDLLLFAQKTMGRTLVVGRKTMEHLPYLHGRKFLCLTRQKFAVDSPERKSWANWEQTTVVHSLHKLRARCLEDPQNITVIGGMEIYRLFLTDPDFTDLVQIVRVSVLDGEFQCDTYVSFAWIQRGFCILDSETYPQFTHYTLQRRYTWEVQYTDLLRRIQQEGMVRQTRNSETLALFKHDLKIDLRQGFPLLTSKKMFFRGIVEELLFFLRGETDSNLLEAAGVNIWKANTRRSFLDNAGLTTYPQGVMGPMYGYQFRSFGAPYDPDTPSVREGGVDQLAALLHNIRTDPTSRRLLLTSYNPSQAGEGVLYPCHSIVVQFFVDVQADQADQSGRSPDCLDMYVYNRSSDVFLGLPFNIASSALLLHIVAQLTDKLPRFLYLTTGDTHLYSTHLAAVDEQLKRFFWDPPQLTLPSRLKTLEDLEHIKAQDFKLVGYECHSPIKAEMVA